MKNHKSPIGWMGGKSKMVNTLLPLIPEHREYIEAFGGAGHLLFGKEPSDREVLNDYDGNLMNFWAVVKNAPEQLIESFNYTLVSRRTFDEYKAAYKHNEYDDCIRRTSFTTSCAPPSARGCGDPRSEPAGTGTT